MVWDEKLYFVLLYVLLKKQVKEHLWAISESALTLDLRVMTELSGTAKLLSTLLQW